VVRGDRDKIRTEMTQPSQFLPLRPVELWVSISMPLTSALQPFSSWMRNRYPLALHAFNEKYSPARPYNIQVDEEVS